MKNKFFFRILVGLVTLLVGLWLFLAGNHLGGASAMFVSSFIMIFNWILWMIAWLQPEVEISQVSWKGVIKGSKPRV